MLIAFTHCGQHQETDSRVRNPQAGLLRCQTCGAVVTTVDLSDGREWVERQVARKQALLRRGRLRTRKQSARQSDAEIDRDGLSAELAACAILCPAFLDVWVKSAERLRNNRGRDLRRSWTGLERAVEVKHTRHQDAQRGFLLVRPPRHTPGAMHVAYIDDSLYVLMVGVPFRHTLAGWTDRRGLINEGHRNPVPVQPGQRESWGLHWSKLHDIEQLTALVSRGGGWSALRRWLADWF